MHTGGCLRLGRSSLGLVSNAIGPVHTFSIATKGRVISLDSYIITNQTVPARPETDTWVLIPM